MESSITRADPLQLPTELLQQIFQDDSAMLTTCMLLSRAWYARMKALSQSFTKITVNLQGVNTHAEHWKNGIIGFMNPTLTSVAVKTNQEGLWQLLELLVERHAQVKIRFLEINIPSHCIRDFSRLRLDFDLAKFDVICESLTNFSIDAWRFSDVVEVLRLCPHLSVFSCHMPWYRYGTRDTVLRHCKLRALQIVGQDHLTNMPTSYFPYLPGLQVLRIISGWKAPYNLSNFLRPVFDRMPNIKILYVGRNRMSINVLDGMHHDSSGVNSPGLQEVDLEKRVDFQEQDFHSFFKTAYRTLTRLRFEELHYIRLLRGGLQQELINLRELELGASLHDRHDYTVDLIRFLSRAPNLAKLSMLYFDALILSNLTQTISQLRCLHELRIHCRTVLGLLDISYLGHLPCIKKMEIRGGEAAQFDRFLDNLAQSGGFATLGSLKVQYIITNSEPQDPMDALLETCTCLEFAELRVMNQSGPFVYVFPPQQQPRDSK